MYSEYVKAYILYARTRDLQQTKDLLIEAFNKDTMRLDIMQEVGKFYYFMREYDSAYHYYNKFTELKEAWNLDIYRGENAIIGFVLSKIGLTEESEKYFKEYKDYAENDQSIYKHLSLAAYYSYRDETEKAIEHLGLFSEEDNYFYWITIFIPIEPMFDNIKDLPEFKEIMNDIDTKFWKYHEQIKASLKEKGLI